MVYNQFNFKELKNLYFNMYRIRLVEEEIAIRYSEQEMRCPVHLSTGQESAAVGVTHCLKKSDTVYSSHRSHAHYLARNGNLKSMISEIYGKSTGCVGGRGGSMHLYDLSVNFMTSIPIIGSSIPLAVGNALSNKIKKNKNICVSFFGDAAIEEGVLHECMNLAATQNLKVLFVCENNQYSIFTHLNERQPKDRSIGKIALAHNIFSKTIDCSDVRKVISGTNSALNHINKYSAPYFLVLNTYRWKEHCGPMNDDHLDYRDKFENEKWMKKKCAIKLLDKILEKKRKSWVSEKGKIKKQIITEIEAAFKYAKKSKLPSSRSSWRHIYA